jgi:hypothetical protein
LHKISTSFYHVPRIQRYYNKISEIIKKNMNLSLMPKILNIIPVTDLRQAATTIVKRVLRGNLLSLSREVGLLQ